MKRQGWSKKTEKIEVRLSPETKRDFLETCEQQSTSVSAVVRRLIEDYVDRLHMKQAAGPLVIGLKSAKQRPYLIGAGGLIAASFLTFAFIMLPGPAEADPPLRWERDFSARMDQNGDRELSLNEVACAGWSLETCGVKSDVASDDGLHAYVALRFAKMDVDRDESVSRAEYGIFITAETTEFAEGLDANADGVVSFDEFTSPPAISELRAKLSGMTSGTAFRQGQAPEDLDPAELTALWAIGKSEIPPPKLQARLGQVFADYDRNDDGRITVTEFLIR